MLRTAAARFRHSAGVTRHLHRSSGKQLRPNYFASFSTVSTGKDTIKSEVSGSKHNKCLQSTQVVEDYEYHFTPDIAPPFKKILAANRGEIATRIMRACSELGVASAGIYSHEDRFTQHRYKADQAFLLSTHKVNLNQIHFIP